MLRIAVICAGLSLSGCAGSLVEQAFAPERVASREDATCQSYGANPGSDRYQNCRMQLAQMRGQHNAQVMAIMAAAASTPLIPPKQSLDCTSNTSYGRTTTHCD